MFVKVAIDIILLFPDQKVCNCPWSSGVAVVERSSVTSGLQRTGNRDDKRAKEHRQKKNLYQRKTRVIRGVLVELSVIYQRGGMSDCAGTNRILTLVKHCHWFFVISRQSVTVLGSSSQPTSTATWLVAKFRRECQKWANICSNSRSARFHFLPPFPGRLLSAACRDCNSGFIHWKPMKKRVRAKNYHRGFWQEYRFKGYYFCK